MDMYREANRIVSEIEKEAKEQGQRVLPEFRGHEIHFEYGYFKSAIAVKIAELLKKVELKTEILESFDTEAKP